MTLTKTELQRYQSTLAGIRARLRGDVAGLTSGALDREKENSSPTDMAELGSDAWEQDFALDLIGKDENTLRAVIEALKKLDDGTFGLCEGCVDEGKPKTKCNIPKARLKAIPWTTNCVECERKREKQYL